MQTRKTRSTLSRTWIHPHRGFTLVELMIALVLGTFLIGAVVLTYLNNQAATRDSEDLSRVQENIRIASQYLVRDVRNAGFRDEDLMLVSHERAIRAAFARISDGALRVRYAGQGHCAEAFTEIRLIENEYFVNNDGELVCVGRSVPWDTPVADTVDLAAVPSDPVVLVTGVEGIAYEFICPSDNQNCASCVAGNCRCELAQTADGRRANPACLGVRISAEFEGLRAMGGGAREARSIELIGTFRNVVLQRIIDGLEP